MIRLTLISLIILLIGMTDLNAQANWKLAAKWTPDKAVNRLYGTKVRPEWIEGGENFWYPYLTKEGWTYWLVSLQGQVREELFDQKVLAKEMKRLTNTSHKPKRLGITNLKVIEGRLQFDFGGHQYLFDLLTEKLERVKKKETESQEPWLNMAPDGKIGAFIRGYNLFIKTEGEGEAQITSNGEKELSWGKEWVLYDKENNTPIKAPVTWSPDSRFFCVHRADLRQVKDLWLVDHLHLPRPKLQTYKCPMPGEKVPQWELWVFDRSSKKMIPMEIERFEDQTLADLFIKSVWWSKDSKTLYFTRRSRDYMKVDLCAADPLTGKTRVIIEERIPGMVYLQEPIFLEKSERLLWWSMRDGWGHYYLYDLDGALINRVTQGPWTVRKTELMDEESGLLYFMASGKEQGRNPYYSFLYKVKLDGEGLKLLTPEDGEHQCSISPSKTYFVDTYSRVDSPNRNVIRDMEGELLLELETADISRLEKAGWKAPEIFRAKSADGVTDQWGVMYKPHDFSSDKSYPIITRGYPGRQSEFLPLQFLPVSIEATIAQLGFIVVKYGNRGGCPERGLEYREYAREDFRDYALADKKVVVEQLAERYDWIDLERVGIMGSSSGGFMTMSAMLVYPDFFKVGVAMTAPNDPSIYFNIWAERYFGIKKVKGEDGVERWESKPEGNLELAKRLQGDLLMIYGAQDNNVHPAHLYRMADAFIKAGKRFDMFVIPGADHSLGDSRYLYSLAMDYFVEHLLQEDGYGVNAFWRQ